MYTHCSTWLFAALRWTVMPLCAMLCCAACYPPTHPPTRPPTHPHCCRFTTRELLRHHKALDLPEPLATPSQLARIRELGLPLSDAAAATLTQAQVRW